MHSLIPGGVTIGGVFDWLEALSLSAAPSKNPLHTNTTPTIAHQGRYWGQSNQPTPVTTGVAASAQYHIPRMFRPPQAIRVKVISQAPRVFPVLTIVTLSRWTTVEPASFPSVSPAQSLMSSMNSAPFSPLAFRNPA